VGVADDIDVVLVVVVVVEQHSQRHASDGGRMGDHDAQRWSDESACLLTKGSP
jgi:hypothetical protein